MNLKSELKRILAKRHLKKIACYTKLSADSYYAPDFYVSLRNPEHNHIYLTTGVHCVLSGRYVFEKESGKITIGDRTHIGGSTFISINGIEIGNDVTIVAIGNQVAKALNVCRKLKEEEINAEVINARFLKPFDKYTVLKSINKTHFVVTIEDNSLVGGLGAEVKELIAERRIPNVIVRNFGYPDVFVEHGTPQELEEIYKLDEKSVYNYITNEIKYKKRTNKNNKSNKKNKTKKYVDNKANKNIDESQNKIG